MAAKREHVIWVQDTACIGWTVAVPRGPAPDLHDRWFQHRTDAQLFAAGLHAASGWPLRDQSTSKGWYVEQENESKLRKSRPIIIRHRSDRVTS